MKPSFQDLCFFLLRFVYITDLYCACGPPSAPRSRFTVETDETADGGLNELRPPPPAKLPPAIDGGLKRFTVLFLPVPEDEGTKDNPAEAPSATLLLSEPSNAVPDARFSPTGNAPEDKGLLSKQAESFTSSVGNKLAQAPDAPTLQGAAATQEEGTALPSLAVSAPAAFSDTPIGVTAGMAVFLGGTKLRRNTDINSVGGDVQRLQGRGPPRDCKSPQPQKAKGS